MELIGGGRASQVFALDDRTVLRRSGFDVSAEARLMRFLHGRGFPVPEVFAADGGDLTMRRLHGPTLGAEAATGRIGVDAAARTLLELHERLHAIDAPDWLPAEVRGLALGGAGTAKILHLDLHPENVVVTDDGPYLVDWTNAAAGAPEVDLAVSWAILAGIDPAALGAGSDAASGSGPGPGSAPEAGPPSSPESGACPATGPKLEPGPGPRSVPGSASHRESGTGPGSASHHGPAATGVEAGPAHGPAAAALAELAAVLADRSTPAALETAVAYREADPNVDAAEACRLRLALDGVRSADPVQRPDGS